VKRARYKTDEKNPSGNELGSPGLRNGFEKAVKDPELLAEAKKSRMDVDPTTGDRLEKLAHEIFDQPAEVVSRVKKILAN
jgi:hypothetical protein